MQQTALVAGPPQFPARVTGSPRRWALDFAIIGGVTSVLAPLFAFGSPVFAVAAGFWGAATGMAIGRLLPETLERVRGRFPIPVLLALGVPIGAVWGGVTGALAGLTLGSADTALFGAMVASVAGAVQFGWLWFPYTFLTVLNRTTIPVVAAACVVAPTLGWLGIMALVGAFGPLAF